MEEKSNLRLRGLEDPSDFDIIADIHNKSALKHYSANTGGISAKIIADQFITGRIAETNGIPVGYIFITKDGTYKEKNWRFAGPICLPNYDKTNIEKELLDWLMNYAREMRVSTLTKVIRASSSKEYYIELLAGEGFVEERRMFAMRLELTEPPSTPRSLPDGLELVDYRGKEDFDILLRVLEAAFDYGENRENTIVELKQFFGSIKSAYIPICIETISQQPIGTIAVTEMRTPKGKTGIIATYGVIPSFQGRGIGSVLMKRAIEWCWNADLKIIELVVRVENKQALRIYEHFGFHIIPNRTMIEFKNFL